MDNLSIIIQARLNASQAGQAINQEIQSLSKQLAPLQLKLDTATSVKDIKILADGTQQLQKYVVGATDSYGNQVKIVQKLNAETDQMVVSQLKLTENNKLYNASLMETQALKNDYNKQLFSNFNQSLGIGVVDPNRINASNSALKEYYNNVDKISRVSTVRTSDAINSGFIVPENRITASNSALREYYAQMDRISKVSTVGTSEAIGNSFNNFRSLDTNRITSANSALAQLFTNSNRNINSMTALERQVVSLNPEIASLTRQTHESAQSFSSSAQKMIQWTLIGTAIFGTLRQISSGFKYVYELENNLNQVRIVTGQTQEQVEKLAVSYNKLAKEMSVTTSELTATAADLFRQGLDNSQVEDRMKAIVEYAKISSISLEDSNTIITATANATGESVQKIIDIFALLGDTTASGADEIGEALTKVASASENSNISLEKSASWLATISSVTRESASTIGRSLNSVISRYESIKKTGFNSDDDTKINDVVKALSDIGIKATDSQGQLLDFAIIMDTVGEKFSSLSKNEKAYIATTMFGTFQRNRGLTLLNNYSDSLKNYENALNSAGTADSKFAIYQESSAAAMDRLKASWESFWQSSVSTDFIKGGLNSLSSFINTFGNLGTIITAVTTAILIFKGTDIANWFRTSTIATQGFRVGIITTRGELIGLTEAEIATRTATTGLTLSMNALKVAFMSNPLGFIATAALTLVTAFDVLSPILGNMKSDYEKLNESQEKEINSMQKEADSHKTLASQYEENIQKAEQLIDSRNKLEESSSSLADTDSKKIDINTSIIDSEQQLGAIIGQEALNKLRAAGFSQEATNIVIQALQQKQDAEKKAWDNSNEIVSNATENLKRNIVSQIEQVQGAIKVYTVWGKIQETFLATRKKLDQFDYDKSSFLYNLTGNQGFKDQMDAAQGALTYDNMQASELYFTEQQNEIGRLLNQVQSLGGTNSSSGVSNIPSQTSAGSSSGSSGSGSSSSSVTAPSYEDPTAAIINSINLQNQLTKAKGDTIKAQLDEAKTEGNSALQMQKTNELIANQITEQQQLSAANDQLAAQVNPYERRDWVDANGELTAEYYRVFNSSSAEAQKNLSTEATKLQDVQKAIKSNIDAISSLNESILAERNTEADDMIDLYKKAYQEQKDISTAVEDERHTKVMNNLDAEIKKLDDKATADSYNKNLAKSQSDAQKIQNEINVRKSDTSPEGLKKLHDLQQQLADSNSAIADTQSQHDLDLRKKSLDDQKTAEDAKTALNKKTIDDTYTELVNSEQKWADIRQQIISGNVAGIKTELINFVNDFAKINQDRAKDIGVSFQALISLMNQVNAASGGLSTVSVSSSLPHFASGGQLTGSFSGGKLSVLHEKELVLNKMDTSNLLQVINTTRDIAKNFMPNIQMPKFTMPNLNPSLAGAGGIAINLNIANLNNTTVKEAQNFAGMITNELAKKGIIRR